MDINIDRDFYGIKDLISNIVNTAKNLDIRMKLFGSIASYIHILNSGDDNLTEIMKTYKSMKSLKDLDFVASGKDRGKVKKLFMDFLGFEEDFHVNRLHGRRRHIYYSKDGSIHIDIYFDKLEFNHDIDVRDELRRPGYVLSIPYLILTKLQINKPTKGDIIDIQLLIYLCWRNSECRDNLKELYRRYLSNDWGFWYDSILNLERSLKYLSIYNDEVLRSGIKKCIEDNISYLNGMEKGKKWLKRAKIGASKEWYRDVEEPRI